MIGSAVSSAILERVSFTFVVTYQLNFNKVSWRAAVGEMHDYI